MSTTTADAGRSPLTRLYLTRGVLAVAWAAAFAGAYKVHESLSAAAALAAFGAWAVLSGAAQVTVGIRRRGPELGKQWPMLIAGGIFFIV